MLSGAAALHQPAEAKHQSLSWFSADGGNWSEPAEVADKNFWLWRVTWHKGTCFGVGYATDGRQILRLYRSTDGRRFETHVEELFSTRLHGKGYPNETSLVFLDDDTCLCLLRRDADTCSAQLGISQPPYVEWSWKDLGVRLGGPHMIRLPDGRFVAAGRLYDGRQRTALLWLDPKEGTLQEFLTLPSGGDTSYPGLVWHDGLLWVSYYSSHEGKAAVYLAKVRIE
jgi:hypothetical protein